MNINRAKQMFGGMAAASVSHGREELEEGRYVILLQSVTNEESRKYQPYMAFNGVVLYPLCDKAGREPTSELYEGSGTGAQAAWAVFSNDFFASKVKTILVTCLGLEESDLKTMEKEMTPSEIDKEFFEYCLAMTGEEVQGTETVRVRPGIFDNTTTVEIRVTKTEAMPKKDDDENKPGKVYTLSLIHI